MGITDKSRNTNMERIQQISGIEIVSSLAPSSYLKKSRKKAKSVGKIRKVGIKKSDIKQLYNFKGS
jgi:hypothetical protein